MGKGGVSKERKLSAMMMSALAMTPDDELEDFRRKRLGRDSTIDPKRLALIRDFVQVLAGSLRKDESDPVWDHVADAARVFGLDEAVRAMQEAPAAAMDASKAASAAEPKNLEGGPAQPLRLDVDAPETLDLDDGPLPQSPAAVSPDPPSVAAVSAPAAVQQPKPLPVQRIPVQPISAQPSPAPVAAPASVPQVAHAMGSNKSPWAASSEETSPLANPTGGMAGSKPTSASPLPASVAHMQAVPVRTEPKQPPSKLQLPSSSVPAVQAPKRAAPLGSTMMAVHGDPMGGTGELKHVVPSALPFQVVEDDFDASALAEYAALRALCAVYPGYVDEMNRRYRYTAPGARQELDEKWRQRFVTKPGEKRVFDMLCDHLEDWVRRYARS